MSKITKRVDDLLLDQDNPRLGHVASQAEALAAIIQLKPATNFKAMMRSIKEHGLDPGDAFYVVDEGTDDGELTVVDGNRRLAALKVLLKPTLLKGTGLPDSAIKPLLKEANGFDKAKFRQVACYQFTDRAEAAPWIERRHGNELGGEGRIPWGPLEIQNFQKDRTMLDLLEFVEKNAPVKDGSWEEIRSAVVSKPHVLRRLMDAKRGKAVLGLSKAEDPEGYLRSLTTRDPAPLLEFLLEVFGKIASGHTTTRTLNNADNIEKFLSELDSTEKLEASTPVPAAMISDIALPGKAVSKSPTRASAAAAKSNPSKTVKVKPPRATLAPSRLSFNPPTTSKGEQLIREACSIKMERNPLASAFLLRAILQHAIDDYMLKNNISFFENRKPLELKDRAIRVIDHIIEQHPPNPKNLRGVKRNLCDKGDPASIQALNDYHHDAYQVPNVDTLRNAWDSAEALFHAVYGRV